jgi:hypothetical protein
MGFAVVRQVVSVHLNDQNGLKYDQDKVPVRLTCAALDQALILDDHHISKGWIRCQDHAYLLPEVAHKHLQNTAMFCV